MSSISRLHSSSPGIWESLKNTAGTAWQYGKLLQETVTVLFFRALSLFLPLVPLLHLEVAWGYVKTVWIRTKAAIQQNELRGQIAGLEEDKANLNARNQQAARSHAVEMSVLASSLENEKCKGRDQEEMTNAAQRQRDEAIRGEAQAKLKLAETQKKYEELQRKYEELLKEAEQHQMAGEKLKNLLETAHGQIGELQCNLQEAQVTRERIEKYEKLMALLGDRPLGTLLQTDRERVVTAIGEFIEESCNRLEASIADSSPGSSHRILVNGVVVQLRGVLKELSNMQNSALPFYRELDQLVTGLSRDPMISYSPEGYAEA